MPSLASKLKDAGARSPGEQRPVWTGPCGEGRNGGITFSALSRYLVDKERFRIHMLEGLRTQASFEPRMEYGNMWHVCEEALAAAGPDDGALTMQKTSIWQGALTKYCKGLCSKFPLEQDKVNHWYEMCKAAFPLYAEHWSKHPDVLNRKPLVQEHQFDVHYKLPSGRLVRLRGKFDSVDLIDGAIWLQENKTKTAIDQVKIVRQMRFDLQTMMYIVALHDCTFSSDQNDALGSLVRGKTMTAGVRYNVVRRSAHKSTKSMLTKIEEDRADGRIGEWFSRWQVKVYDSDIERFKTECLNPLLENLCDDYDWWTWCWDTGRNVFDYNMLNMSKKEHGFLTSSTSSSGRPFLLPTARHFRMPYGVYNPLLENGASDLDSYLESGSRVGLRRVSAVFEELVV